MIRIYYPKGHQVRTYLLIKQGLINNIRVKLVDSEKESDFVFYFYIVLKRKPPEPETPPEKTVFIDFYDKPDKIYPIKCFAYFKRSWMCRVDKENYTVRGYISWPSHFYPLSMAIMDEFIIGKEMSRDIILTCTLREYKNNPRGHLDRIRALEFLKEMDIQGNTQIGEFNDGSGRKEKGRRDCFRLMKRSKIIVTCSPSDWEGDHRIWESLASGALVFSNRLYTPLVHPLIDGKHCIFYDLSDSGLKELKNKILYFMQNPIQAESIAREGFDFAMKYHRASNRIDEILEVIT